MRHKQFTVPGRPVKCQHMTSPSMANAESAEFRRRSTELDRAIRLLQEIRLIRPLRAPEALTSSSRCTGISGQLVGAHSPNKLSTER
jgi:hypothetical protein